jgi:hypothetical protein
MVEIKTGANRRLAKVAVQCSADTFVVNQSLVLRSNICGENRHLRQAPKRQAVKKLYFFLKMSFLMPLSYSLKLIEPS